MVSLHTELALWLPELIPKLMSVLYPETVRCVAASSQWGAGPS